MKILAVDSSSVAATACIWEDNFLVGEYFLNTRLTHSQTIMEMVESLCKESGIDISEIDVFASAIGPGSFTGLRIGIAAVKGMAIGAGGKFTKNIEGEEISYSGKPCVGVSTLEGLANNMEGFEGIICPVMDARCNQVYTAIFEGVNDKIIRLYEDSAISIDELYEVLKQYKDRKIYFVGDGAKLCMDKLGDSFKDAKIAPEAIRYSRASSIAKAAEEIAKNENNLLYSGELVPAYIRLPQAQRERNKKLAEEYNLEKKTEENMTMKPVKGINK